MVVLKLDGLVLKNQHASSIRREVETFKISLKTAEGTHIRALSYDLVAIKSDYFLHDFLRLEV
jgi:hypothetical protein